MDPALAAVIFGGRFPRRGEEPKYLARETRTFAQQVPADDDRVHHRKDSGAPVIVACRRLEVRKQARDIRRSVEQALRDVRREQSISQRLRSGRAQPAAPEFVQVAADGYGA
ncbi:hypothetical protein [Nocardia aobensis]|uniref:hypothetical protein n=1 Tax=Nocardia aobensis TaxID=257277 RepID=UPI00056B7B0B|nr:hypothetical protein [Nocardia aobensis]